jgi:CheY-like chemotaxis protein
MDGFEATREIRRLEAEGRLPKHTPIIALTANATTESEAECKKAGMDGFLVRSLCLVLAKTDVRSRQSRSSWTSSAHR